MRAVSDTVNSIERSPIRFILDRAAQFADAIHLEIGQPDFPTPPHVIEAAVQAARHAYTGYTANAGMRELREAIVVKLARENEMHVSPENVIVTVGAMEAVFATMAVILDPGEEILLPDPGYGNFVMAAKLLKLVPRLYPTPPEKGFLPDFAALEEMVNERTRALFINSPSNPTGAVYPEEVMRACLDFCRRHDLYLISDETYERLIFEGEHVSPAKWDDEGRVVSIFTVSKTYSMTGWRVGYTVANEEIIAAMTKIQEPIVSCVNTVAQHAAIAALLGPQDCVQEMLEHYRRRRDLVVALAEREGLEISYPHGAFYVLVDISPQPLSSLDFSCQLLEEEHVAVAPGISFGQLCERYVRISLCASEEALQEGLTRLARYLRRVSLAEPSPARAL
ncbi:MAG: pyridoxal phosphate-dependent aminotransferase [Anaerolineae bacterium]|nr:pyridoxal phosphate-dependent aminotransferase [Anaerolineae bacterium]